MKKVFVLPINKEVKKILDESYDTLFAAAKFRSPHQKKLTDDQEI